MKRIRTIDQVAKALDHNTAITLITTFGTHNSVMVFNASTNQLIATVYRISNEEALRSPYFLVRAGEFSYYATMSELRGTLYVLDGYPRGASKSRNYSRPVLKAGVVL